MAEVWWQAGERGRARFMLAFANGNLAERERTSKRAEERKDGFERARGKK